MHGTPRRVAVSVRRVCRAAEPSLAPLLRRDAPYLGATLTAITRITYSSAERNILLDFVSVSRYLLQTYLRTLHRRSQKYIILLRNYITSRKSRRFMEIFPENKARFSEIFRYTQNSANLLKASLSFFARLAIFGNYSIAAKNRGSWPRARGDGRRSGESRAH